MNRNTNSTILKFSVVIMLMALVMFFVTPPEKETFVAVSLTMLFCTAVFVPCLVKLCKRDDGQFDVKPFAIALSVWLGATLVCVILKIII